MQLIITIFTFILSAGYVLFLDSIASSTRSLQKALILPILILAFALFRLSKIPWKSFLRSNEKWIFLFWGAALVQMLVIATGGLHSPFLILIHLFMLGLCFLFTFPIALFFLVTSFAIIFVDIAFHGTIAAYFLGDPSTIVLQLVSLVSIIPIAYVISQKYHVKDWLSSVLRKKVLADEAILESLHEMIIITDATFRILSVNDAVERALRKSRSELMYTPIFDTVLLKDAQGKLVTIETLFPKGKASPMTIKPTDIFTLVTTALQQRDVMMQIQTIKDPETNISQFSFILSSTQQIKNAEQAPLFMIDRARVTYEAMSEDIKKKLEQTQSPEVQTQLLLLQKIESDIYNTILRKDGVTKNAPSRIDLAKLCQNVVAIEQDFAKAFRVPVGFILKDFGEKDIAPLTVKNFQAKPETLTGPFFTVSCDVKNVELVIRKLLDMSILLSSKQEDPDVTLSIERKTERMLSITITATCASLSEKEQAQLFLPYYETLWEKTNLHVGSGLEGFLVKITAKELTIPIETTYKGNTISFSLSFKRFETEIISPKATSAQKR